MPGVFITATGTDAGKTYVSSGLIAACRRAGRPVDALKPVISGYDASDPDASDTAVLLRALGEAMTTAALARVSPWRYAAPLSPDMAAALEGRALCLDEVVSACRDAIGDARLTIVEGAGGVMVPLEPGRTMLDLMQALELPIILVSPTGLGAISHLLTAVQALDSRGLRPTVIVLNETPGATAPLDRTVATLGGFLRPADLVVLRRNEPALQADVFDAILATLVAAFAAVRRL